MMTLRHVPLTALLVLSTVAGCGVVYTPQEFEESSITYGYRGGYEGAIKVVSMDFFSARIANAGDYTPRALPSIFSQQNAPAPVISTRQRLAEAGLDRVTPALELEPPTPLPFYDPRSETVAPVLRNEARQPLPAASFQPRDLRGLESRRSYGASAGSSMGGGAVGAGALGGDSFGAGGGAMGGGAADSGTAEGVDSLRSQLRPPAEALRPDDKPIPVIQPEEYLIGPGDVIGILSRLQPISNSNPAVSDIFSDAAKELLVQGDGEIYIPQAGAVNVGGLTLTEARGVIFDRLVDNQLDFDFGVEILRFGSKTIAVSGPDQTLLLPVTVKPTTLGDAVFSAGGVGLEPENTVVRVLRDGTIYEMTGDQFSGPQNLAQRYLKAGDIVSIVPVYDLARSLEYFDQQIRLRELERAERSEDRTNRQFALDNQRFELETQRFRADNQRFEVQNQRENQRLEADNLRFEIEKENYRLQAERLRQEGEIGRLAALRESDRSNEDARIANIEARQAYLDRLRTLELANIEAQRDLERGRREVLIANIEQRARERRERRELLELELQDERLRLQAQDSRLEQERSLFNERVRLGAVEQDFITIAGETNQQTVMPLPFNGKLSLSRALYQEANGLNVLTADSSEIYVIRTSDMDQIGEPLTAYHLDASNPAALAVASVFEMRPNDVVYVNPQPVTNWNRVITSLLPSTGLLQSGVSTVSGL